MVDQDPNYAHFEKVEGLGSDNENKKALINNDKAQTFWADLVEDDTDLMSMESYAMKKSDLTQGGTDNKYDYLGKVHVQGISILFKVF
ncbi:hypothetical protein LIER_07296 [Lithospermum erythrorhizon]|uniref:Uncharacterized protein n=1 Tax=Lithospermum erythrorhizon TaxID=34254 RepID=A0AAV3P8H6_LITER